MDRNTGKLALASDAHLVITHISISGHQRRARVVEDQLEGDTRLTEQRVDIRIDNEPQFIKAKELASRLRSLLPRHCSNSPLGWLTDSKRLEEWKADRDTVMREIDDHNSEPGQCHRITGDTFALPIGMTLDERAQRALCAEVTDALNVAKDLLRAGDRQKVTQWLAHRRNLSALMPLVVGQTVDSAIEAVRDANRLLKRAFDVPNPPLPEQAGAALDLSAIDVAIDWASAPIQSRFSDTSPETLAS